MLYPAIVFICGCVCGGCFGTLIMALMQINRQKLPVW
jgi:hypothetical protein